MNKKNASRLGKVLIEKGIITKAQLDIAVIEQIKRRQHLDSSNILDMQSTALGEVLIELGFISRLQLKRCLNWQLVLRKMTITMSLLAPLMTMGSGATAATSSSSASNYSVPFTLQAENYSLMSGVQPEPTTDVGGGFNVGYIHANDWMSYTNTVINIPVTGNYKITYRIASPSGGGSFILHEADKTVQYDTVPVPGTGGSQTWRDLERTISLTAGNHALGITALTRGSGYNINWLKIDFKGVPLPVTIQAENYSAMLGVQTQITTDTGGGLNVGYIHENDWMSYADTIIDIPTTGTYKVTYRVASQGGGGSFSFHEADGTAQYDTVPVPNTGGSQKWVNVERIINLNAGSHRFSITALARGAGYNINWFKVESAGTPASASSSSMSTAAFTSSNSSSSKSSSSDSFSSKSYVSSSSQSPISSTSSSSASIVSGPVHLRWNVPIERENGDDLDITEVGGYEVRYRRISDEDFTYITINDAWTTQCDFSWLNGTYEFQVAVFDKNGIYSQFVNISPR